MASGLNNIGGPPFELQVHTNQPFQNLGKRECTRCGRSIWVHYFLYDEGGPRDPCFICAIKKTCIKESQKINTRFPEPPSAESKERIRNVQMRRVVDWHQYVKKIKGIIIRSDMVNYIAKLITSTIDNAVSGPNDPTAVSQQETQAYTNPNYREETESRMSSPDPNENNPPVHTYISNDAENDSEFVPKEDSITSSTSSEVESGDESSESEPEHLEQGQHIECSDPKHTYPKERLQRYYFWTLKDGSSTTRCVFCRVVRSMNDQLSKDGDSTIKYSNKRRTSLVKTGKRFVERWKAIVSERMDAGDDCQASQNSLGDDISALNNLIENTAIELTTEDEEFHHDTIDDQLSTFRSPSQSKIILKPEDRVYSHTPSARTRDPKPACILCRKMKIKCDRERPQCGYCVKREVTCNYPSLTGYKRKVRTDSPDIDGLNRPPSGGSVHKRRQSGLDGVDGSSNGFHEGAIAHRPRSTQSTDLDATQQPQAEVQQLLEIYQQVSKLSQGTLDILKGQEVFIRSLAELSRVTSLAVAEDESTREIEQEMEEYRRKMAELERKREEIRNRSRVSFGQHT